MAARVGRRGRPCCSGSALLVASSVAFAFADSIVVLDIARFVQGLGGAATWAGALGWLIGAAPRERRGELIGTALAAAVAGALFGPVLGALADAIGQAPVFGGVAVARRRDDGRGRARMPARAARRRHAAATLARRARRPARGRRDVADDAAGPAVRDASPCSGRCGSTSSAPAPR